MTEIFLKIQLRKAFKFAPCPKSLTIDVQVALIFLSCNNF